MKSRRPSSSLIIAIALFVAACVLGVLAQSRQQAPITIPRARYSDSTPLGGKGLRLLLERLDFRTRVESGVLPAPPKQAKVWLLLDPQTSFSKRESTELLEWVKRGGTLIWASSPHLYSTMSGGIQGGSSVGIEQLRAFQPR